MSTIIALHVTPKSARNEIIGWIRDASGGEMLKLRLNATPEDGKANAALLKFLAGEWKVAASSLTLVSGASSRHKRLNLGSEVLLHYVRAHYRGAANA